MLLKLNLANIKDPIIMKNYKVYIITALAFSVVYILISFLSIQYISKQSSLLLLENEITSAKQLAKQIAEINGQTLKLGVDKTQVVKGIQKSIEDVNDTPLFLTIIDWSGKVVCHPDITKVGSKDAATSSTTTRVKNEISAKVLYNYISNYNSGDLADKESEIIRLDAIPNSDLIAVTHLNLKNVAASFDAFNGKFLYIFIVLGLLMFILLFAIIRYVTQYYYAFLEKKSEHLEGSMLSLTKLNSSLENYQKNLAIQKEQEEQAAIVAKDSGSEEAAKELPKKRLLTYIRNELMPIPIEDISYIYLENTITFIVRKDGKRFTANDSLDQTYSSLDQKLFFRANRQIIVSIYAINRVIKFGNNSLKIETNPASEVDIIIGKNKASAFKQWLDL